jgi:CRP/FNR family nitrogen fixation transcriptional regulator
MMGAHLSFCRNAEIYGQGETADYIYRVVSGAVRTYKVLADGRRQVGGFYLPGDLFGLEPGDEHTLSAEAIAQSKVLLIKRTAVLARAERDSELARELWTLTAQELRRGQDHLMLLIKSAHERVAAFLLEMAERLADNSAVELPMSRQEIADHTCPLPPAESANSSSARARHRTLPCSFPSDLRRQTRSHDDERDR